MPPDTKEAEKDAERMLDLFYSVGATRFNVTFLDLHGRKTHLLSAAHSALDAIQPLLMDGACGHAEALHC